MPVAVAVISSPRRTAGPKQLKEALPLQAVAYGKGYSYPVIVIKGDDVVGDSGFHSLIPSSLFPRSVVPLWSVPMRVTRMVFGSERSVALSSPFPAMRLCVCGVAPR